MWPVTISLPKYKESYILTLVDKYCALNESYQEIYNRFYRAEDDPRVVSFNRKMQHLIENFETENQF